MKYSSFEHQKHHEYEYKQFLQTLQINKNNSSKQQLLNNRQKCYNKNYLFQRQINLQSRQDKRKVEYERIEKENFKFSQRLINAKAFLNQYEQKRFFEKHCQLKQRLQRYPNLIRMNTKKSDCQFLPNNKLVDSSFLIYHDQEISSKSIKLQEKHSKMNNQLFISKDPLANINKPQINHKKLPCLIKHNSQFSTTLPSIIATTKNIE